MSDSWQRPGETLVHKNQEVGRNFELFQPAELPSYFADGIAGAGLVGSFGRIEFFTIETARPDPNPAMGAQEKRLLRLRVTLPIAQLLEGLIGILSGMAGRVGELEEASKIQMQALETQIAHIKNIKGY